jgi:hypothetical protein
MSIFSTPSLQPGEWSGEKVGCTENKEGGKIDILGREKCA